MSTTTEARRPELGHVPIRMIPVHEIVAAPENARLYRPVCEDDPEVQALADSIAEQGVREPLVLSVDGWLVSGHRRLAAAKLAGLEAVPCRIDPAANRERDPDGFLALLLEYNRQRVKTFDEVAREEVVSMDPEDCHRELVEYRRRAAGKSIDNALELGERRERSRISKAKRPFLDAILRVMEDRRDFWPLSDRQIHYALLNDPPPIHASKPGSTYTNTLRAYKALVELLTRARLVGAIPMHAIADETRPVTVWECWPGTQGYLRKELNEFLRSYARDLMQSQPVHVEIVGEKNTIAGIIKPVASDFCIPVTTGRGYCSLPPRAEMVERFRKCGRDKLVLLMLSDLDPDGQEIARSFPRSLRDDFGIPESRMSAVKVALTQAQVRQYGLRPMMQAKKSSRQYKKFIEAHGTDVYELEALEPRQLQQVLRDAILSVIDVELFNHESRQEQQDAVHLEAMRRKVQRLLHGAVGEGDE